MPHSSRVATGALILTTSILTLACSSDAPDDKKDAQAPTSQFSNLEDLKGVWQQKGYAQILEIDDKRVRYYDVTSVSCVMSDKGDLDEIAKAHDRIEGTASEFSWYEAGAFTRYEFDRIDALPATCADQDTGPTAVFEAMFHLYEENYAFFTERGIDWQGEYDTYHAQISEDSTDDELFDVFEQMLTPFNDGHVYVYDPVGGRGFLGGSLGLLWESWAEQYEGSPIGDNPIDPRGAFVSAMQDYVLSEILADEGKSGAHDLLHWGWLNDDVAYLDVHRMASFEVDLSVVEATVLIDETMSEVMKDFAGAKAVVIDARFNQGGMDTVGYAIAGWFTDNETLVSRKRATYGDGFTDSQDIMVTPREGAFTGPVALLLSRNSVSATETFALAMASLPQVTSVGTRTYGSLSDSLVRLLPNGWIVAQSNEIYESPEGDVYEAQGVPPDVLVPYDDDMSFEENLARTLERALSELPG